MKTCLLGLALIFISTAGFTQISNFNDGGGVPLKTKLYTDIEGSPYLGNGDWLIGSMWDVDGDVIENAQLRFNAYDNELEYYKNGTPMVVYKTDIVAFDLLMIDSDGVSRNVLFKTGFEMGDDVEKDDYVRVIFDGESFDLLQLYSKDKIKITPASYGEAEYDKFVDTSEYFLKSGDSYEEINANKRNFLKYFDDKKSEIKDFMSDRTLDYDNPEDLQALMKFIDELYSTGS